jgi:hypothetical protein
MFCDSAEDSRGEGGKQSETGKGQDHTHGRRNGHAGVGRLGHEWEDESERLNSRCQWSEMGTTRGR